MTWLGAGLAPDHDQMPWSSHGPDWI